MLDHISLGTANLARARKFYDAALKPLGYKMVWPVAGYGAVKGEPKFWIGLPLAKRQKPRASAGTHVAFMAENRKAVDAFYKAAIRAGAKDNGKPGLRPEYHANYYGAFVFDPEGHAIEAVCHKPE
ncbi:MAG TPA: VOC family protein [Dongiaceae bacterium]|nr:VOC family protein [Dongiaceae bacterium]